MKKARTKHEYNMLYKSIQEHKQRGGAQSIAFTLMT